ncbi:MAG: hypothetical protein IJI43_00285 [Bacilli bacterium]|nr:hypothetical protein [Bacilli bacterium]
MKKLNNKGFVLVETLIVTVFIMTIFTIIYMNFYPQIAEYQRREFYDDIDSKYDIYWFKRMVENDKMITNATFTNMNNNLKTNAIYVFNGSDDNGKPNCTEIANATYRNQCNKYVSMTGIIKLYLTYYHLGEVDSSEGRNLPSQYKELKTFLEPSNVDGFQNTNKIDEDLLEYLKYLPEYKFGSLTDAQYRIIAEFKRTDTPPNQANKVNYYKTFATIEVKR